MKVKDLQVGKSYKNKQTNARYLVERGGFLRLKKVGVIRRLIENGSVEKDIYPLTDGILEELGDDDLSKIRQRQRD
jgi:hypothetical protein